MKKLLYTLLAVSIIFSACKKEDDEPNNSGNNNTGNNTSSIIGKWNAIYYTDNYYETSDLAHGLVYGDLYWGNEYDDLEPFYHLEFTLNDELIITTFGENSASGATELEIINTSYYVTGNDFYVLDQVWPFGHQGTGVPNKILLLDNTNLNFSVPCGWSENGGFGEQILHCVRIQ